MDRATISTSCKTATDEFIDTNNPISVEFIESKVQKGVSGSVQCKDMYNAYVRSILHRGEYKTHTECAFLQANAVQRF